MNRLYQYEYTDDTPRDFPTLGLRGVKKGDLITSDVALNSPHLKEVAPAKPSKEKPIQQDANVSSE